MYCLSAVILYVSWNLALNRSLCRLMYDRDQNGYAVVYRLVAFARLHVSRINKTCEMCLYKSQRGIMYGMEVSFRSS